MIDHWEHRILNSVTLAARGDRKRLLALAQALEEADIATDTLRGAGFGDDNDGLLAMVAVVVEGQAEQETSVPL